MDSAISPDMGNDTSTGGQSSEVCVPLEDLAIDGNTPAVGDTVDFAIEAKVTSIDKQMAYVQPTKVNGQDVMQEQNETDAEENVESSFDDNGNYMGA